MAIVHQCITCNNLISKGDARSVRVKGKLVGYVHSHKRASYGKPCHDGLIAKHGYGNVEIAGEIVRLSSVALNQMNNRNRRAGFKF